MKYKVKADLWITIILIASLLIFVPFIFFAPKDEIYVLLITTVFMAALILPIFKIYYELGDDDLIIHMYFFKKRIKYENIKSIRKCENWLSSAALSRIRVEIVEHNKKKLLGTTYISPQNRDEFFSELKHRCRKLDTLPKENPMDAWN